MLDILCNLLGAAFLLPLGAALGKVLGREWHRETVYGVAGRSYIASGMSDDPWISSHLELRDERDHVLSGYGWIFPLGNGEVNVATRMRAENAPIGGEGNGGVILSELHLGRDAPVGAALMLQLLLEEGKPLSKIVASGDDADLPGQEPLPAVAIGFRCARRSR